MKKLFGALVLVAALAMLLTACGEFKCDGCGEEKSGDKHETEMLGKKVVICEDCYEELTDLAGGLMG